MEKVFFNEQTIDRLFIGDRLFWMYGLLTIFFTILGAVYLCGIGSALITLWVLSNLLLWYVIYVLAKTYMPWGWAPLWTTKNTWFLLIVLNLLYLTIMVVSLLWCAGYNSQSGLFRVVSPILVIIGGLFLISLARYSVGKYEYRSICLWSLIIYCGIWTVLALITTLTQS